MAGTHEHARSSVGTRQVPRKRKAMLRYALVPQIFALGLTACGSSQLAPDPDQATVTPAPDPLSRKGLENLDSKATPAQIQWVIEHPVRAREYPTAEEQLEQIGVRLNIIDNSGEQDLDQPVGDNGHYPFTDEFQPTFDAMIETVYDKTSSGYDTLYAAATKVTQNNAAFLALGNDVRTTMTAVEGTGVIEGDTATVLGVIDTVSRSNPGFGKGPGMRVAYTLRTGPDGIVRVEHTKEQK